MRRAYKVLPAFVLVAAAGCAYGQPGAGDLRTRIQAVIDHGLDATRRQDIEAYMATVPEDLQIHDESGVVVTRDQQRQNILRDWSIIPRTLALEVRIDSLTAHGDTAATVYTSQRWERLMRQRTGTAVDTVLTTQVHRERWRRTPRGWRSYDILELGGHVWVNGRPWQSNGP